MAFVQPQWLVQLEQRAQDVGIGFAHLVAYLWNNHEARDKFITDCQAGNIGSAINDLIDDYKAANPTP